MSSGANDADRAQQSAEAKAASSAVSPAEYAAFIEGIKLERLWLVEAMIRNYAGPNTPTEALLRVGDDPDWCEIEGGFRAQSHYKVRVTANEESQAEIDVTFAVDFASPTPMTDDLFDLFGFVNLPLNTWPFLREFVHTTFGRMDWVPFALPAIKRGTRRIAGQENTPASTDAPSLRAESDGDMQPGPAVRGRTQSGDPKKGRQSRSKKESRKAETWPAETSSAE
jgi:hypothetical protein